MLKSECHIFKAEWTKRREYSEGQPEWWADGNVVWSTVGKKKSERGKEEKKKPRDFLSREKTS